jgi:erythritol kinase (D-erythritol 1-phosphate-forming)
MKDGILVGIDAGTSVIKSVAFTTKGEQLAVAALPNSYTNLPNGGVEQDMARTWDDAAKTLRMLGGMVDDLGRRVIAVAVTGQGDGTWLIDKDGDPVAPAWLWLDSRATDIAEEFMASPGYDAHYRRTGTGINACQQSTHLVWMKRHAPEVLARAASAHHCKDWLYYKLTDARVTDPSEANFTFGHYESRSYDPGVLEVLGAPELKRLLPPAVDGTEINDALTPKASAETGLRAGTPVALGYLDVICTGLGGGLYDRQGRAGCTIQGSTGMHMRLKPDAKSVKLNADRSGYTMAFPVPGAVVQMQSNMAATLNIDWLLDLAAEICAAQGLARGRSDLMKGLDDLVLAAPPGRLLYHPYISRAGERGPFLEPTARAGFIGLEAGVGYGDLMRAIFEGLCHAARDCYSAMGPIPEEVRLTGGAARSRALRLLLASALKARVRSASREESGAAGAAMMAAVAQKIYPGMTECAAEWVEPLLGETTEPDATLARGFDRTYPIYVEARQALRPVWRALRARSR